MVQLILAIFAQFASLRSYSISIVDSMPVSISIVDFMPVSISIVDFMPIINPFPLF
jgi:hypothetical protein